MELETERNDKVILELLAKNEDRGIDLLFRTYYKFVTNCTLRIVGNPTLAEDLAQEVFLELVRKRDRLPAIQTSLRAYLKRAAINRSLNYQRDQKKMILEGEEKQLNLSDGSADASKELEAADLQALIDQAIEDLPERCRAVFLLSRFEDMSYRQIAEHLDISIKTVENQITKALKQLREALRPYLNNDLLGWIMLWWIFF